MNFEKNITANYIKYVITKTEKDLHNSSYPIDLVKAIRFLNFIKNSHNILRDIYIATNVSNLEPLGKYMLFMMKKAETGQINFENLIPNMEKDKEFLVRILTGFFKTDKPLSGRKNWKDIREEVNLSLEEQKQKENEDDAGDAENKFKIEELDNELVTEEFIDKNIEEIEASQKLRADEKQGLKRSGYLELIKNESEEEEKKVFNLPGQGQQEEAEDFNVIFEEVQKTNEPEKEKPEPPAEEPENAAFGFEDLKKGTAEKTDIGKKEEETLPEEKTAAEEKTVEEEKTCIEKPEPKEEITTTEQVTEEKEVLAETETPETTEQLSFIDLPPGESDERRDEYNVEKEELSKEAEVQVNSIYQEYESELITRNALLITDLDELSLLIPEESYEERKIALIDKIIENSSFMEKSSAEMSFEIITNIYGIIKLVFNTYKEKEYPLVKEYTETFKNSIHLIESLIKGDTFGDYDKVINETEKIKTEITEKKKEKENLEKIEKDKQELEKHLSLKYTDTTQREKLALLKQYILELEKIFSSLDEIKSEFQVYEALRKLSATFVRFKEMVNISRILNIGKLAQLSEASYIFVKFLQNYRLDPYDEDVKEIFKFIIYNFKLIFLDKPTKDLDIFISILNDPVQVFSKSKKKKNE